MVRVLPEKGLRVVAAVRVFTSQALIKLKGVTVKVDDWNDEWFLSIEGDRRLLPGLATQSHGYILRVVCMKCG